MAPSWKLSSCTSSCRMSDLLTTPSATRHTTPHHRHPIHTKKEDSRKSCQHERALRRDDGWGALARVRAGLVLPAILHLVEAKHVAPVLPLPTQSAYCEPLLKASACLSLSLSLRNTPARAPSW